MAHLGVMYIYAHSHAPVKEVYQEILGTRKILEIIFAHKHMLLYTYIKSYGKNSFPSPNARFHTMGDILCLMEKIVGYKLAG